MVWETCKVHEEANYSSSQEFLLSSLPMPAADNYAALEPNVRLRSPSQLSTLAPS